MAYTCECGCEFKQQPPPYFMRKHLASERHIVMLNGGTRQDCSHMVSLRSQLAADERTMGRLTCSLEKGRLQKFIDKEKQELAELYAKFKNIPEGTPVIVEPKVPPPPKPPKPPPMTEEEKREHKNMKERQRRLEHKDDINAKRRVKVTCECGMEVSKQYLAEHIVRKQHATLMQKKASKVETPPTTSTTAIDI